MTDQITRARKERCEHEWVADGRWLQEAYESVHCIKCSALGLHDLVTGKVKRVE
jgi:hypothetical protein